MNNYKCPELTLEQKSWLEEQTSKVNTIFIGVHGSHLYGLDREGSDIDIKVIYLPSKQDLILGQAVKTYNKKNDDLNIEVEMKSLSSFLKSAGSADTNCIDLLHAPEEMILFESALWGEIKQHKRNLYAKNMKGVVGYINTHTHKYSNKLDRLNEMKYLKGLCVAILISDKECTVNGVAECSELQDLLHEKKLKYIKPVTLVKDHEQQYLEVCGKKYIYTWSIQQLIDAMDTEIKRYGKRSEEGVGKGMDTKSLSHALRVLLQLKEILLTKNLEFPLKDSDYIKKVKTGEVQDVQEVMDRIDNEFNICMKLLEECDLPDEIDLTPMYSVIENYYFG